MTSEFTEEKHPISARRPECMTIKFANGMTLRAYGAVEIDIPPPPGISINVTPDRSDVFSREL
jgi:hypothetical protein